MVRLLEAFEFARELDRPAWDFAVEIQSLREMGLTNNEFRWLVCKGLVEHGCETTRVRQSFRTFRRQHGLVFGRRSCFVLTQAGVEFARSLTEIPAAPHSRVVDGESGTVPSAPLEPESPDVVVRSGKPSMANPNSTPKWDLERRELRVGSHIVKQFKTPAANQERILAAFEEEGWPARIDDPLPPQIDQDPKRRLHDTINSLNRNQKRRLIRFMGDGTGEGIRWCLIARRENDHCDSKATEL
jgi:hypothetical protein